MSELNRRKVSVLVHPIDPSPEPPLLGIPTPGIEFPFDTTRAIINLLTRQTRIKFPDVNLIFSHGGGTVPFLADRIAWHMSLPFMDGQDKGSTMKQMQAYHFDLAFSANNPQLAALEKFVGPDKLLVGTDCQCPPFGLIHNIVRTHVMS